MGNCLKTELKAAVNNPNLPIFGEVQLFEVTSQVGAAQKSFYLESYDGSPIIVHCDANARFTNGKTVVTLDNGYGTVTFDEVTANTIVSVTNHANLLKIVCNDGTSTMDSGTAAYWSIKNPSYLSDMSHLVDYCVRNGLTDLSIFPTSITRLQLSNAQSNADITGLGSCINLTTLYGRNSTLIGEIKDLADAQVTAGRTSGTLDITCSPLVTLDGVALGNGTIKQIQFNPGRPGGYVIV